MTNDVAISLIAGEKVEDLGGLIALLGHDLRSPVAIIISALEGVLSLYEDDPSFESVTHILRGALASAYREQNMIADLLDLARLEGGCYELRPEPVDLGALLRQAVEQEQYTLNSKGLTVTLDIPEDQPVMALAEAELISRCFSALLDNTLKFTVRKDSLEISLRQDGEQALVTFRDSGRPIYPEFEQGIMGRGDHWGQRLAGSRTSVGLGMPFVRAVAVEHGGSLTAKTDTASGMTAFTLALPLPVAAESPAAVEKAQA